MRYRLLLMLERAIEVALGAELRGIWKMKECLES
jgi:hypothetical protein